MRLFGVERHPTVIGMALRSHECLCCGSLQTDVVPFNEADATLSDDGVVPLPARVRKGSHS
jgi:hypothetical protein